MTSKPNFIKTAPVEKNKSTNEVISKMSNDDPFEIKDSNIKKPSGFPFINEQPKKEVDFFGFSSENPSQSSLIPEKSSSSEGFTFGLTTKDDKIKMIQNGLKNIYGEDKSKEYPPQNQVYPGYVNPMPYYGGIYQNQGYNGINVQPQMQGGYPTHNNFGYPPQPQPQPHLVQPNIAPTQPPKITLNYNKTEMYKKDTDSYSTSTHNKKKADPFSHLVSI